MMTQVAYKNLQMCPYKDADAVVQCTDLTCLALGKGCKNVATATTLGGYADATAHQC